MKKSAICCNGCDEWYHAACAGIEAADLPSLEKYESVHWYCKIYNTRASQLPPKKFVDAVDKIRRKQDANETARTEDYQQQKEIKEFLKQVNSTIKQSMSFERKINLSVLTTLMLWKARKSIRWKNLQTLQPNVSNEILLKFW